MKNQKYWSKRAKDNEDAWTKRSKETVEKEIAAHYQRALRNIKGGILKLYANFAKDNGLDFSEGQRLLSGTEFKEWRMSMQEYLQLIANGDKGLERELNTLAMRPRITRLEKLYAETLQELDKLGRNVDKSMKDFLTEAYQSNYAKDIFDFVKIGGLSVALSKLDNIGIEKVIASKWSGKNYSQRIWTNTKLLGGVLKETVANGVHRGLSIQQMSRMVENKMHSGYSNAVRLVRTEMNFVNNHAHFYSMKDAGIDAYEFIAVLDNRTSSKCKTRDGETYLLEEKSVGFNYPPLHPRCRSTVAPVIEGVSKNGSRIAKDKSGKYIEIPSSMNYKDYEKVYIKKETTLDEWNKINQKKLPTEAAVESKFKELFSKFNSDNTKSPVKLGDIADKSLIMPTLKYFEKQIVTREVENAVIITSSNEVYHCSGDKNNISSILELGDKLKGAYVTHNHPIGSANEYSFSKLDIELFIKYKLSVLRGIDEKFIYELNRNFKGSNSKLPTVEDLKETFYDFRHQIVENIAKELKIGYQRWQRDE